LTAVAIPEFTPAKGRLLGGGRMLNGVHGALRIEAVSAVTR
jgi:hypothetical protein